MTPTTLSPSRNCQKSGVGPRYSGNLDGCMLTEAYCARSSRLSDSLFGKHATTRTSNWTAGGKVLRSHMGSSCLRAQPIMVSLVGVSVFRVIWSLYMEQLNGSSGNTIPTMCCLASSKANSGSMEKEFCVPKYRIRREDDLCLKLFIV